MRAGSDPIPTSRAGSLPRPDRLIETNRARGGRADKDGSQATNVVEHPELWR